APSKARAGIATRESLMFAPPDPLLTCDPGSAGRYQTMMPPPLSTPISRKSRDDTAASDLRSKTGLAPRSRPSSLRAPRRADGSAPRGAIRRASPHGPRVAGARRPCLPDRRRGGTAGGGPERVEPREPARALLGVAHTSAPPRAPDHVRPLV